MSSRPTVDVHATAHARACVVAFWPLRAPLADLKCPVCVRVSRLERVPAPPCRAVSFAVCQIPLATADRVDRVDGPLTRSVSDREKVDSESCCNYREKLIVRNCEVKKY